MVRGPHLPWPSGLGQYPDNHARLSPSTVGPKHGVSGRYPGYLPDCCSRSSLPHRTVTEAALSQGTRHSICLRTSRYLNPEATISTILQHRFQHGLDTFLGMRASHFHLKSLQIPFGGMATYSSKKDLAVWPNCAPFLAWALSLFALPGYL